MLFVGKNGLTLLGLLSSPLLWAIILSVVVVIKGARSGNAARYFGNPLAALPKNWQRWALGVKNPTKNS